jgi:DNA (cytosine-5)-methyltransferase 1
MKINQLDLFSGIGGFHLGFERAGYEVTSWFSEVDKHAIAVYKHQFKKSTYVGSVTDVRGADLPRIDLVTFGSPCQDFSQAGGRRGLEGDRSSLIAEAIRLIGECRPRVFIWENVKGTFSSNDGADFAAILQAFVDLGGYRCEWQLLNTAWFLPQNRERVYLVGHLAEARGDWGGVFPITEKPKKIAKLQGQQAYTNTILRVYGNDAQGSYIGERELPSQKYRLRRMTAIECERLQGFPDNHTLYGSYEGKVKEMSNTQRYKQCGNAVTVDVVAEIAKRLLPLYE